MSETFGQLLRRVRRAKLATLEFVRDGYAYTRRGPLTQNQLALWAGLDPSYIHILELDRRQPSREAVEKLADALTLDPLSRDRLLVSAGFWPWPEELETTERALSAVHGPGAACPERSRASWPPI